MISEERKQQAAKAAAGAVTEIIKEHYGHVMTSEFLSLMVAAAIEAYLDARDRP